MFLRVLQGIPNFDDTGKYYIRVVGENGSNSVIEFEITDELNECGIQENNWMEIVLNKSFDKLNVEEKLKIIDYFHDYFNISRFFAFEFNFFQIY